MNGIVTRPKSHQDFSHPQQLAALSDLLSDPEIDTLCRQLGHAWRHRIFAPGVTVLSLIHI